MIQPFEGRVWCVDDDVNTDLILPIDVLPVPRMERRQHMFRANRPGWARQVQDGDVLIAGSNFGMGSGRPATQVMKDLGLSCVVAESLNGLFFRNCVNFAFPALEVPGVRAAFEEGDRALIDFEAAAVTNVRTGRKLRGAPWPEINLRTIRAGGLIEKLDADGLLHPVGWAPPRS
jgi:3-isopropylmalate/(R)-2-methylmalate dehydratase small subunit